MSEVIKLRATAEIEEEAAAWVWRLDADNVPAEARRSFEHWLRRDPRHQRAFEELGGVWRSLDSLAEAKREEKIATFMRPASALVQGGRGEGFFAANKMTAWIAASAATVLMTFAVLWWVQSGNEAQTIGTAVGQQRSVSLTDGSSVSLNTNTILETRFVPEQRMIRLVKGEALFKVAHDPKRPFVVRAGNMTVRALGTEFNVRLRSEKNIEVIVAEGSVEVAAQHIRRAVGAGQKLDTAAPAVRVSTIKDEDLSNALAWRSGAVVFNGEPLSQAISELNRYTDTRLIVTDPRVRDLRVGGRFRADDVGEFIRALEQALPVSARTSDNLVYIEPRT